MKVNVERDNMGENNGYLRMRASSVSSLCKQFSRSEWRACFIFDYSRCCHFLCKTKTL